MNEFHCLNKEEIRSMANDHKDVRGKTQPWAHLSACEDCRSEYTNALRERSVLRRSTMQAWPHQVAPHIVGMLACALIAVLLWNVRALRSERASLMVEQAKASASIQVLKTQVAMLKIAQDTNNAPLLRGSGPIDVGPNATTQPEQTLNPGRHAEQLVTRHQAFVMSVWVGALAALATAVLFFVGSCVPLARELIKTKTMLAEHQRNEPT